MRRLVPYRPEMINIIRAAYDHGVTFFDTAEAYGPLECERILGESIAPFRNKVVITSKFGWNIDPETGQFQMGLNSKPDHIKKAVEGMLKRLRTDRIDLLVSAPRRPAGPDRGCRRRSQGPDVGGQGSALGSLSRWARIRFAARMRRFPSPPCRTSTRCCGAARKK